MIYTSTKALQFLSIPVYTIFKNLTIILIAYGEVLWFGGSVTSMALFSFGLMVMSSIIAAWADIQHALQNYGHLSNEASAKISTLNAGYIWMMFNCFCSATYVLGMKKRIKLTNFKDFDSKLHAPCNLSSKLKLIIRSHVLQQPAIYSYSSRLLWSRGRLVCSQRQEKFPPRTKEYSHHGHGFLGSFDSLHLLCQRMVRTCDIFDDLFNGWSFEQVTHCHEWTDIL